jgi:MraZ protein
MFLGQYRHNIDDKGRLTIPARFRELLAEGAYVLRGFDQNLMVLTPPAFEAFAHRANQMSITDPKARELKRLLFSTAERVEPDKSGRILLPQYLREMVGLEGEVVLSGAGDHFEIWQPTAWNPQMDLLQDPEASTQRFTEYDLSSERPDD